MRAAANVNNFERAILYIYTVRVLVYYINIRICKLYVLRSIQIESDYFTCVIKIKILGYA